MFEIERLCGWHGFKFSKGQDGKRYLTLGYWLYLRGRG